MKSTIQDKNKLVNSVFSQVYKKYDLMNDIMSLGVHRVWKEKFIDWMNPQPNTKLIDVASGTGDIANLFFTRSDGTGEVICVEPNKEMLSRGKIKLKKYKSVKWINSSAESIPIEGNTFDYYSISYGIRNVSDINKVLKEAFRVLKPGGRFMCLEFSKIDNEILNFLYKQYSKTIPYIGKFIVGSDKPYKYLIDSIDKFYNQKELSKLIKNNGFSNVEFRNVSNGISAIHSGWKI
jgi:demethylmenaquinone methyltransferase/2-methoxy-6-polyprenyl-1,4-benzoquinol methylase|tara:strand:+ start:53 stop:757 length:705 start_codon:yes stop_codon:yes gene_type:complete